MDEAPTARPPDVPSVVLTVEARRGDAGVLIVRGEADLYTALHLRDSLIAAMPLDREHVLFDLSGLTFCDLAGMTVLRGVIDRARARGVRVEVIGMSALQAWLYAEFAPTGLGWDPFEPASTTGS